VGIGDHQLDAAQPAAMERVRRKLAGADDGNRQTVDILNAVPTVGLQAVEAACAEAASSPSNAMSCWSGSRDRQDPSGHRHREKFHPRWREDASTTPSTSSIGSRPRPAMVGKAGSPSI
jgi:hypothetical protein